MAEATAFGDRITFLLKDAYNPANQLLEYGTTRILSGTRKGALHRCGSVYAMYRSLYRNTLVDIIPAVTLSCFR